MNDAACLTPEKSTKGVLHDATMRRIDA